MIQRARTSERGKVRVAQLDLYRTRKQAVIAKPPRYHFRQIHEHCIQCRNFRRIHGKSVLVTDGFWLAAFSDFAIEPAARVKAVRLAREREPPLSESLFKKDIVERRKITDFADSIRMEALLGDLADPRDLTHIERREKTSFSARDDPQNSIGLCLIRSDLCHHARRRDSDGAIQIRSRADRLVQPMSRSQRRAVETVCACQI